MIRKLQYYFMMMCVLHAFITDAKNISAEQALESAILELTSVTRTNANVGDLRLVGSKEYNGVVTLYVFSSPSMYVIASANDNTPALIAYSLDGGFTEDVPPSMQWWMSQYSENIVLADDYKAKHISRKERRHPISPMLSTKWGQSEPFNNLCPIHDGIRPVTGCVATAIAQIMRFYSYPNKGVGTTGWTCNRYGSDHDHYYDFDSVIFDWESMIDSYGNSASQKEKNAVAELMVACGAASEMQYSPYASGSFIYLAAKGMIDYLQYDWGMEYLERKWFASDEEWDDICYQELAEGRPILYGGEDDVWHTRHAFVMDGFSEEGLYHINWGWEGENDGYFRLIDFSFEGGNYRINHSMVRGIKPLCESSEAVPSFAFVDKFKTNETQYKKEPGVNVWFMKSIQNESMFDFWIHHGVKCVPTDGSSEFYVSGDYSWYRFRGINRFFEIPAEDFPEGVYDVYPVFKTDTSDWMPFYRNKNNDGDGIRFEVTETMINLQSAGIQNLYYEQDGGSVFYNLNGIRVERPDCGVFIKVSDGNATVVKVPKQ